METYHFLREAKRDIQNGNKAPTSNEPNEATTACKGFALQFQRIT